VRWEWFYYGRPKIGANRYFEQFMKTSDGIEATTNADWYSPIFKPSGSKSAVEML
jgi:hypothetical protein